MTDHQEDSTLARSAVQLLARASQLAAIAGVPRERTAELLAGTALSVCRHETGDIDDLLALSRIPVLWHQLPHYLDDEGTARRLSIKNGEFAAICREAGVRGDPALALERLARAKVVAHKDDHVELLRREVILRRDSEEALAWALHSANKYLDTLLNNLDGPVEGPLFDRAVVSSRFSKRHIPALLSYVQRHGASFMQDLDEWISVREDQSATMEVGIGLHVFIRPFSSEQ